MSGVKIKVGIIDISSKLSNYGFTYSETIKDKIETAVFMTYSDARSAIMGWARNKHQRGLENSESKQKRTDQDVIMGGINRLSDEDQSTDRDNGDQIRLSGEGEGGPNNGVPGDLYVSVSVKPHKFFQRDGDDILCEVPISFTSATLGDKIILPTLEGKVELTVPAGTQSGRAFRIKNKGVKSVRSSYKGDLYCKVNIETPVNLTKEQKELLNKLDESFSKSKSKHRPNEKSWLDGIKEFFDK